MKFFSLVSSSERLGANEVHRLLISDNWKVVTLRSNSGEIFDSQDYCLGLNRIKVFSILLPVIRLFRYFPKDSFILADGIFPILISRIVTFVRRDVKFVALIHNDYTINNRTRWKAIPDSVFNVIYRLVLSLAPRLVTTSVSALNAVRREGFKNVACIDNIVEIGEIPEKPASDLPDFWFIGRLVPAKNVGDILEVARKRRNLTFNIVGEGSEYEVLLNSASENVRFLGYIDRPFGLIKQADVFMLPSSIEGKSLALMRAASSGMILCLSDIAENRFVDGLKGCYFHNVGDVDSILNIVDNIISIEKDHRVALAVKNKESMDLSLDLEVFRRKYKELFTEL